MLPVLSILFLIFKVIIAFSILIMIHELGHFIVAKRSGVWVEEFGLGLPPRIIGKKVGDTIYSLNWLPIGGFVRLHGETSSDQVVYPDKAFTNKKPLVKIAITLAGIVMNFILAIICFSILFFVSGIPGKVDLTILKVYPNSPAEMIGLQPDDIVSKVNGVTLKSDDDLKNEVSKFKGQSVSLEIIRDHKNIALNITPRTNPPAGEGSMGIQFGDVQEYYYPPIIQRPFVSVWYGVKQTFDLSKAVVLGLGNAAHSVSQGQSPEGLSGPVGIIAIAKRIAELGILALVNLVAVISVNLAIVNLIPFPPLDGSRIALIIAEKLTKKKMTPKLEERVYLVGFAVLIGIMILVTSHEIPALIKAGGFDKYADTLLSPK
jgi:regulator of sigma E protease